MKLICQGCNTRWTGADTFIGKSHAICKAKGTWREVTAEDFTAKVSVATATPLDKRFETEKEKVNAFTLNWHSLLWDRKGLLGWAVAAVDGYRDAFVELIPNYGDRLLTVLEPRLAQEISEGKTFVLDPIATVELLLKQLGRHQSNHIPPDLVEHLLEAQKLLAQMREGFTPPKEWTTHVEQIDIVNSVTPFFLKEEE